MESETVYFEIQQLLPIGLTFIVLGIGLAYGLSVLGDVRDDSCTYGATSTGLCKNSTGGTGKATYTADYNASKESIDAISKIPEKLGLIVTVVIAAILIGILVRYLLVRM